MWVSKRDAAAHFGVSVETVERRLRKGELQGQKQARPQGFTWLVEVPDPPDDPGHDHVAPLLGTPVITPVVTPSDTPLPELVQSLQDQIHTLKDQLRVMNQALSSRDKENLELVTVIRQAQAMLPPPPTEPERRRGFWGWLWGG